MVTIIGCMFWNMGKNIYIYIYIYICFIVCVKDFVVFAVQENLC